MTIHDHESSTVGTGGPPANDGAGGLADQARQTAGTATEEGKHVAGVAKEEARQVASEAQAQARDLIGEARHEVQQQARGQLDSLVGTLQGFAEDLERMARGEGAGSGLAKDVVQQVGDRARSISSQLKDREPGELVDQARDLARRRPGTFLLGALAAGVVAGRLARGAKDAAGGGAAGGRAADATADPGQAAVPNPPQGSFPPVPPAGTATADPLAGTGRPQAAPAYPEGTPSSATTWGAP